MLKVLNFTVLFSSIGVPVHFDLRFRNHTGFSIPVPVIATSTNKYTRMKANFLNWFFSRNKNSIRARHQI